MLLKNPSRITLSISVSFFVLLRGEISRGFSKSHLSKRLSFLKLIAVKLTLSKLPKSSSKLKSLDFLKTLASLVRFELKR